MIEYQIWTFESDEETETFRDLVRPQVADFLEQHLDQYGDSRAAILRCLDYASSRDCGQGGGVVVATDEGRVVGAVVLNDTGMAGYIPENILVYISVHGDYRGRGLGKALMSRAIDHASGSIALHVEPDNPARRLYEKLGFTSKYLEMRLHR